MLHLMQFENLSVLQLRCSIRPSICALSQGSAPAIFAGRVVCQGLIPGPWHASWHWHSATFACRYSDRAPAEDSNGAAGGRAGRNGRSQRERSRLRAAAGRQQQPLWSERLWRCWPCRRLCTGACLCSGLERPTTVICAGMPTMSHRIDEMAELSVVCTSFLRKKFIQFDVCIGIHLEPLFP